MDLGVDNLATLNEQTFVSQHRNINVQVAGRHHNEHTRTQYTVDTRVTGRDVITRATPS